MCRMGTRVRAEEKVIRHVKVVERRGWDFRVTQGALGGGMPKGFNRWKARSVDNTNEGGRGWHR